MLKLDDSQRGLRSRVNMTILFILYALFCLTSALWALEVAQLLGLDQLLLNPKDNSIDEKFNIFYALIARETKITSVLFKSQVSLCDGVSFVLLDRPLSSPHPSAGLHLNAYLG